MSNCVKNRTALFRPAFLILVGAGLFSCGPLKVSEAAEILRYDGSYYDLSVGSGEFGGTWSLRFNEDGIVVACLSYKKPAQITPWCNPSSANVLKGKFTLRGDQLTFTVKNERATVDFEGTISEPSMILKWHSNVLDQRGSGTFSFAKLSVGNDVPTGERNGLLEALASTKSYFDAAKDAGKIAARLATIANRLLKLPFDGAMLGKGYRFTNAYSVIDGLAKGWDLKEKVILKFAGSGNDSGSNKLNAAYYVFHSIDAARAYYERYPGVLTKAVSAQGWAEILEVSQTSDDSMREFHLTCTASKIDPLTGCSEFVTGTPIVISIILTTPAVGGMNADDRALAIMGRAIAVVSALLPAIRGRVVDALLPTQ